MGSCFSVVFILGISIRMEAWTYRCLVAVDILDIRIISILITAPINWIHGLLIVPAI